MSVPANVLPQTGAGSVGSFIRLRARAIISRNYARDYLRRTLDDDRADRPNDFILTLAEIDIADQILSNIVSNYNSTFSASINVMLFHQYEKRYTQPHDDTVWGGIEETSRLVAMWCDYAIVIVEGLSDVRQVQAVFHNARDVILGNKTIHATNVGEHIEISGGNVGYSQHFDQCDLSQLQVELTQLRSALRFQAVTAEQELAAAHIGMAQESAARGDRVGVIENLKKAGKWAFEVSTKIGEGVATAAIKAALGFG